jgi:exonuclease SbcD
MRILHTADWHLGARLGSQDRIGDQMDRLEEIASLLDSEEVDLLLVAGDVFDEHRSEALSRIVSRLARLLKPRIEAGLNVAFVAGNHDREHVFPLLKGLQDLVSFGENRRVIFAQRPCIEKLTTRRGDGLQLLMVPYPTQFRYDLGDERWPAPDVKRAALAAAVRERLGQLQKEAAGERDLPAIMCGHLLIRGASGGTYELTDQEDVPLEAGDIPSYAYVALGHIHRAQQVGVPHFRYCGSIERMDRGEAQDVKSVTLVDISGSGLEGIREATLDATPFANLTASSESDLESAADGLTDVDRTLVSLTLELQGEQSLGVLNAAARKLFRRMYRPPEIRWLDRPAETRPHVTMEKIDAVATVRKYLKEALKEDPDKDSLLNLADDLLKETEIS